MNHVWPSNQVLNLQGNPWNCSCPLLRVTESAAPPDSNLFRELYLHRIIIIYYYFIIVTSKAFFSWSEHWVTNQHPFHSDQSRKQAALDNHRRSKRKGKTKNRSEGFIGWKRSFNFSPHWLLQKCSQNPQHLAEQWGATQICTNRKPRAVAVWLKSSPSKRFWKSLFFPNVFHGLCTKWTREINGVSGVSQYDLDTRNVFFLFNCKLNLEPLQLWL